MFAFSSSSSSAANVGSSGVSSGNMGVEILEIDGSTPHPGVVIDGSIACRETNGGWVTLRSKSPLCGNERQWAMKVIDQGEGTDGSGLMMGLLPSLSSQQESSMSNKYISELGGWCLSRAGDSYGSWKCDKMPFSTGCVVEFDWDAVTRTLYMVSGKRKAIGHIPNVSETDVLYPAFSMYYLNQKLSFV
ncbi:putative ubiquitin-protein ligase [Trypanosoma conorhini]|uniref:Putative ubiquitin-protein ligase n=1 Tax=Trypanosoma conorhini TaxID=83891 RepID=A0A3R7L9X8_9TRYP|nr:putative ubiquitin-protein ligase [Trypanosoma conorhini]RNF10009.1 putative ubiquitin-protein ligase [Trypanosoma conorhini]